MTLVLQKPSWAAIKAARLAGPAAPGSKAVPEPASPDCLAGLSFVFTGELSAFSRDEAVDLAKRFGGYVILSTSSLSTPSRVLLSSSCPTPLASAYHGGNDS